MLIISNYHYIRDDFSARYPSVFGLTPAQFRKQLEELSRHGEFISLEKLLEFQHRPLDRNYILISFDDGLKEQYELAKPILDEMGVPAAFFINTSNFKEKIVSLVHKIHLLRSEISSHEILSELQKKGTAPLSEKEKTLAITHYNYDEAETALLKYLLNFKMVLPEQQAFIDPLFEQIFDEHQVNSALYMDKEMLQALHGQGYLGSHSHRHLPLGQVDPEVLQEELKNTQDFFRSNFGKPSAAISYPYGSFEASTGISEAIEKAEFSLGFTMERAANKDLQEDSLLLSRFDCNDLPGGKNDLFKGQHIFKNPELRKWHKNESSIPHKR
ncbi:Polysaccharide deacetylase [Salinimicrobium catena]|uniref:Polysaccharide deacetylase n=1 Tax=Salinimicrobium catena TaxID=390640 RepID=A0A1H5NB99_9FLAO|nr:polysaccharide deacetylase family protein [Salinimicrobium catena]SDL41967.1 Polysaccharide deacetylase [Salinimicrobium catena]SEE98909.1 Polysaccharide deacetylase [Salinimicrobium catena]